MARMRGSRIYVALNGFSGRTARFTGCGERDDLDWEEGKRASGPKRPKDFAGFRYGLQAVHSAVNVNRLPLRAAEANTRESTLRG